LEKNEMIEKHEYLDPSFCSTPKIDIQVEGT
jgi:hypothetical protein